MSPSASAPLGLFKSAVGVGKIRKRIFSEKKTKKRGKQRKLVNEKSEGTKTVKDLGLKSVIPFH